MRKNKYVDRPSTEEWLGIAELARWLKVSQDLIRRKVYRQEIPHYKVGKLIRFKVSEIEEWLGSVRVDALP